MKTIQTLSVLLAAATTGASLVLLGNSPLLAEAPAAEIMAAAASAALLALACRDNLREIKPLPLKARRLTPVVKGVFVTRAGAASSPRARRAALVERVVA